MSTLPLLPLVHSYERNPWSSVIRDESRERLIIRRLRYLRLASPLSSHDDEAKFAYHYAESHTVKAHGPKTSSLFLALRYPQCRLPRSFCIVVAIRTFSVTRLSIFHFPLQ
jgi:hypothetical protein